MKTGTHLRSFDRRLWWLGLVGLSGACTAPLDEIEVAQSAAAPPDCSRLAELGLDRQTNLHAGAIRVACGVEPGGQAQAGSAAGDAPGANIDTVTGADVYPHVTQSESTVWSSDGSTIVVNFNDSVAAPTNYSGVSVSTDGGSTFTRLLPSPFTSGHGTNFGDPILVYNAALQKWFAGDLVTGCGAQGIGLWTSTNGQTWSVGACGHVGSSDDRDSMWVDNTSTSPFYGRMYISWNDFAVSGGALVVSHSDDGVTWTAPAVLATTPFKRNVQLTGGPDGTVFVAAMDEGGGGLNPRTNWMYRSTDGGASWSGVTMGAAFAPPGDGVCAGANYFAMMTPIWRHMGWGQPGVGPGGVVHYAYAGHGGNTGDTGDIYYVRSTDNGLTWSAPIALNSDRTSGGAHSQWMPSLSVTTAGDVYVNWYDRRNTTDGQNYEMWGASSADNGATWQADARTSSVLIPQPEQPDPYVQACYAGDYDYATAFGTTHYATWTDGRVAVSGHYTQDVFFAPVTTAPGEPDFSVSLAPASLTISQGFTGQSTTTITSTGGFSSAVTLACSGQPAGVTCTFAPNPVTPSPNGSVTSTLTVDVGATVPLGAYAFDVTGTSGSVTHSAALALQVVAGQITVTAPNGGEVWPVGKNRKITWTSSGVSGKLQIELSRDGGATWTTLFPSVANNGAKSWKVTGPATTQGQIRICDQSALTCDTSDASFTIQ